MEARIVLNRIKTPDGTILTSYHRHDYKTHEDANGNIYGVDGGLSYLRRTGALGKDMSVYSDEPFTVIRESLHWGSYGKDGKDKLRWKLLKDMTNEHLHALIEEGQGNEMFQGFFAQEIDYRTENDIYLED